MKCRRPSRTTGKAFLGCVEQPDILPDTVCMARPGVKPSFYSTDGRCVPYEEFACLRLDALCYQNGSMGEVGAITTQVLRLNSLSITHSISLLMLREALSLLALMQIASLELFSHPVGFELCSIRWSVIAWILHLSSFSTMISIQIRCSTRRTTLPAWAVQIARFAVWLIVTQCLLKHDGIV